MEDVNMAVRNSKKERADAIARLREWLEPGDTVYTVLRNVSRSGMQRTIGVLGIELPSRGDYSEPQIKDYTRNVAMALNLKDDDKRGGVVIGGCGMDMGFEIVYRLSTVLFRDNFVCIGPGCVSNDHSNGDRNYEPHQHSDPGYALRHRWL